MRVSGKFSDQALTYFTQNMDFITQNIRNASNIEEQRQACIPIGRTMQQQLREIENIQNMSQADIDHVFGVDRIR